MPPKRQRRAFIASRRAALLAGCGLLSLAGGLRAAQAPAQLPTGGRVAAGAAAIAQSGAALTITQTTSRAVIDWTTFDVGAAAAVTFNQPSAASVTLNRVAATTPSQIFGQLTANGQLYLVNPAGVYFAPGAGVDVAGLAATSAAIDDGDFMAGSNRFDRRGSQGSVINEGTLTARSGGYIALLAPTVRNSGVVTASLGAIAMAAGEAYTLQIDGANTLAGVIVAPATMQALVDNGGAARADGGRVLLTALAADSLMGGVVRTSGALEADRIDAAGGVIRLIASDQVVVGGALSARGGTTGGDGGLIETSAASVQVAADAAIDTRAPAGAAGQWLVDPVAFTVAASGGDITGARLAAELATTSVVIQTTAGDIAIDDPVTWSTNRLTLTASGAIDVNARLAALGAPLTLTSGAGVVAMGLTSDGFTGRIDFLQADGVTPRAGAGFLTIDGDAYTVVTSLGAPGSTTGLDLQGINGGLGGHYALGADINAAATAGWNGGAGFSPLGAPAFTGVFDGLGHTITGLTINRPSQVYVGLFGQALDASIRNLGLQGASIVGQAEVGGVVGRLLAQGGEASLADSFVGGTVSGAGAVVGGLVGEALAVSPSAGASGVEIADSFATAAVSSGAGKVGGLAGVLDTGSANATATIRGSFATGEVQALNAKATFIGGLVGAASRADVLGQESILDSFAIGDVVAPAGASGVGGLAGDLAGAGVTNAFSLGRVTAGTGAKWVGALAGLVQASQLTSTFYDNQVNAGLGAIGLNLAYAQKGDVAGAYWGMSTADLKTPANFEGPTAANGGIDPGWTRSGWAFDPSINHGFPYLVALPNETAVTVYLLLLAGSSVYGATPGLTYEIYSNATGAGGDIIGNAAPQGVPTWSTPLTAATAAGVYSETYVGGLTLGNPDYRLTAGAAMDWTITKAPLTITAANRATTYGVGLDLGTTAFTAAGLVNGDTVTSAVLTYDGASAVPPTTPAGSYADAIAVAGAAGLGLANYAITYAPGALAIAKAPLTVTAADRSATYGQGLTLGATAFTTAGLVNGDTVTSATLTYGGAPTVAANTGAGSYVGAIAIANAVGSGLANYAITYAAGKLLIAKAVLTVTADDQTRRYGEADPVLSETISGFVAGDTEASADITGAATGSTPATLGSPAGVYPIIGSTGTLQAPNYAFTARDGSLTITPVPTPPPPPVIPPPPALDPGSAAGSLPDSLSSPEPPPEPPEPPEPAAPAATPTTTATAAPPSPGAAGAPPATPPSTTTATANAQGGSAHGAASGKGAAAQACAEAARRGHPCVTRAAAAAAKAAKAKAAGAPGQALAGQTRQLPAAARLARATATAAAARGAEPAPGEPPQESFRHGVWLDNASPFDAGKTRAQRDLTRDMNAASVMTTFTLFVLP